MYSMFLIVFLTLQRAGVASFVTLPPISGFDKIEGALSTCYMKRQALELATMSFNLCVNVHRER
jgi:hypothetical protein